MSGGLPLPGRPGVRGVVVCADDFGLAPGVSDAIAELIAAGRLSATSCMSLMPDWRAAAPDLRAACERSPADIGLHLTLTDQPPLTPCPTLAPEGRLPALGQLMQFAFTGRLPAKELRAEIEAQLDAFEAVWGAAPDFVDGHQHVHVLPGVRRALLDVLVRRYLSPEVGAMPLRSCPLYVRDCTESVTRIVLRGGARLKALIVSTLSAGMAAQLRQLGLACNQGFSGLHDFASTEPFRQRMRRFLCHLGPLPLVHVHPGRSDIWLREIDTLTDAREHELAYLASAAYVEDLHEFGLRPLRFAALSTGELAAPQC